MNPAGPVLVTGATGFLGSHVATRLAGTGGELHVLARPASTLDRLKPIEDRMTVWAGDVTDPASLERVIAEARPALVFHLAGDAAGRRFTGDWSDVDRALGVNLHGVLNLLKAAGAPGSSVRRIVRVGTLQEYGQGPTPYLETQREQSQSPYSASHASATHWCQMLQPQLPFEVVNLRPALTYGPGQSTDFLIPALIASLAQGRRFQATEGRQGRDYIFIADVVDAIMTAATTDGLGGKVLNIATGREHAIRDVVMAIARIMGAEGLIDIGAAPAREGDLVHLFGDAEEAARLIGWRFKVPLEDGLRRTIASYRADASAHPGRV